MIENPNYLQIWTNIDKYYHKVVPKPTKLIFEIVGF